MKSRAAVAARRLAHQEWLRDPSVLSSREPAEPDGSRSVSLDAAMREGDALIILCDVGLAS